MISGRVLINLDNLGIGQQEAASGRAVDEDRHRQGAAIGERPRLLAILAADVRPSDEVGAFLADVGDREVELPLVRRFRFERGCSFPWE